MPRKQLRPSIKLRRLYAPLIEACRNIVLTAPPQTTGTAAGDSTLSIVLAWPTKQGRAGRELPDLPKGFPQGRVVSREAGRIVVRHDVRRVLDWLREGNYVSFTAADLFAQRLPVLMQIAKMELKLERLVDFEQHNTSFIEDVLDE